MSKFDYVQITRNFVHINHNNVVEFIHYLNDDVYKSTKKKKFHLFIYRY